MSNDKKALIALMDLVLALADYATTPPGHRGKAIDRVAAERREVAGWRETLHLLGTEANRKELAESIQQAHGGLDMQSYLEMRAVANGRVGIQSASEPLHGFKGVGAVVADGQAARTAVAATERRYRAWQGLEPIEADDSRITDGHSEQHRCCGGKPDCGCARSVGG